MRLKMFITTVLMSLVLAACQAGLSEGEVRAIAADETAKLLEALRPELVGPQGVQGEVGPQGPPGLPGEGLAKDATLPLLKAEGFQLVDKDGSVRAALHMFAGSPQLDLFGSDGRTPLASLGLNILFSDAELTLRRGDGALLARIASITGQNSLVLGDRTGVVRAALHMFAGSPRLELYGSDGSTSLATLGLNIVSSDAELILHRSDEALLARIGSSTEKNSLVLGDRTGTRRVELVADVLESGTPGLGSVGVNVYGPDGKFAIASMDMELDNGSGRLVLFQPDSPFPSSLVRIGEDVVVGGGEVWLYDNDGANIAAALAGGEEPGLTLIGGRIGSQRRIARFVADAISLHDDIGVRMLLDVRDPDGFFVLNDADGNTQFRAP